MKKNYSNEKNTFSNFDLPGRDDYQSTGPEDLHQ